jgi:hypothetical protein
MVTRTEALFGVTTAQLLRDPSRRIPSQSTLPTEKILNSLNHMSNLDPKFRNVRDEISKPLVQVLLGLQQKQIKEMRRNPSDEPVQHHNVDTFDVEGAKNGFRRDRDALISELGPQRYSTDRSYEPRLDGIARSWGVEKYLGNPDIKKVVRVSDYETPAKEYITDARFGPGSRILDRAAGSKPYREELALVLREPKVLVNRLGRGVTGVPLKDIQAEVAADLKALITCEGGLTGTVRHAEYQLITAQNAFEHLKEEDAPKWSDLRLKPSR